LNPWHIVVVGAGGAAGATARYLTTVVLLHICPGYPGLGTLVVNVVGSIAIGSLLGHGMEHHWLSTEWRLFLVTGLLGGLTTFSALTWETVLFSRQPPMPGGGTTHLALNLVLGLGGFVLGEWLGRTISPAAN
jgi:CrcB protein